MHYLDWYAYAVERIADPSSQFSIQENTEDGEHKATVMYLSELHAKRFYVKETLQKDYDDINEARVKIMTVINSWLPDAKLIKIEEVEYEQ